MKVTIPVAKHDFAFVTWLRMLFSLRFRLKSARFVAFQGIRTFLCIAPLVIARSASASTCTPVFPLENSSDTSWQGADAAYSVPLPDGRNVWIFGDTLFGKQRVVSGGEPRMVHNSLGISTCDANGKWHIHYVVQRDHAGRAISYFSPKDQSHWYWAMDGFLAHGDLFVSLLCVRKPAHPKTAAFNFETCGTDLARVSHLDRDPSQWTVAIHPLVPDGVHAYPSASIVVSGSYVYLFALYEHGERPLLLTRIALDGLNAPAKSLQYLDHSGAWKAGFSPSDARQVLHSGNTELSVRYHSKERRWFAVLMDPHGFSGKVLLRTAPELAGPWSREQVVYSVPEMQNTASRDKNVFCYAAKEHPEYATAQTMLITYVCNTTDVSSLATNHKIYFPKAVRVPIPPNL